MSDIVYWIWLSLALSPASRSFKNLLSFYGTPENIFNADETVSVEGLSLKEREHLSIKDLSFAEEICEFCFRSDVRILTYQDENYPALLRDIPDPPVLLYLRGTLPEWNTRPCISVIGTRAMSYYGGEMTFDISYDLAKMGCITVSGMALGVDGVCAASTLQAGGTTIAVLGSGIDVIYPAEHEYLHDCIVRNGGAVITEFAPGERPEKHHFPIRNRIISGISRASIVIEGEAGSGSLITARRAAAQGRAVFAVPGRVGAPNSDGPLLLLKHKRAQALTCADDIYDLYREEYLPYINAFKLLDARNATFEHVMDKYGVVCAKPKEKMLPSKEKGEKAVSLESHRKNTPSYKKSDLGGKALGKLRSFLFADPSEESIERKERKTKKEIEEKELLMMKQMDEIEQKIYKQMPYGAEVHPDAIVLGEMPPEEILSVLVVMEMKGFVLGTAGGTFTKQID